MENKEINKENEKYSDSEVLKLKQELKELIYQHHDNFSRMLKAPNRKYLFDFIENQISMHLNNSFYTMATKCYWILNDIKDWNDIRVQCQHCHKPLKHKNARVFRGYVRPHCNVSCSQADINVYSKIIKHKKQKYSDACNSAKGRITAYRTSYNKLITNQYETILSSFDEYLQFRMHKIKFLKYKCNKCGRIISSAHKQWIFNNEHHITRCYHCYPTICCRSQSETELYNFCKTICDKNKITIINNDKTLYHLPNKRPIEFDISIPQIKLLIEFNGLYYHSIEFAEKNKNKNHTLITRFDKTIIAEKLGYQLIHIEEIEWNKNKDAIKLFLQQKIEQSFNFLLTDDFIFINRSLHNKNDIPIGYKLINEIPPSLHCIKKFHFYDCGILVYQKI